jgi:hypothetical protein
LVIAKIVVNSQNAINNLERIISGLPHASQLGRRRAAEDGINDAKRIVHVQTGALQRSIRILSETQNTTTYGSDLDYAYVEEYGNSRRPAHPYLRPRFNVLREGLAAQYVASEIRTIL